MGTQVSGFKNRELHAAGSLPAAGPRPTIQSDGSISWPPGCRMARKSIPFTPAQQAAAAARRAAAPSSSLRPPLASYPLAAMEQLKAAARELGPPQWKPPPSPIDQLLDMGFDGDVVECAVRDRRWNCSHHSLASTVALSLQAGWEYWLWKAGKGPRPLCSHQIDQMDEEELLGHAIAMSMTPQPPSPIPVPSPSQYRRYSCHALPRHKP